MNIREYITRKTNYDAQTVMFISDLIDSLVKLNLPYGTREAILQNTLGTCTFTNHEIESFAKGEVPTEYEVVPVDVRMYRMYRVYVRVPKGSENEAVKEAAKRHILNNGLDDTDLVPDWGIEEDDICGMDIDWEGAQEADE